METNLTPGKELLLQVRIEFLKQGKSLTGWCRQQGTDHSYAYQALTGKGSYPAILAFRQKILTAAGLIDPPVKNSRRKQA